MKRTLIALFLLACIAVIHGTSFAELAICQSMPASSMTEGGDDGGGTPPEEGGGAE